MTTPATHVRWMLDDQASEKAEREKLDRAAEAVDWLCQNDPDVSRTYAEADTLLSFTNLHAALTAAYLAGLEDRATQTTHTTRKKAA